MIRQGLLVIIRILLGASWSIWIIAHRQTIQVPIRYSYSFNSSLNIYHNIVYYWHDSYGTWFFCWVHSNGCCFIVVADSQDLPFFIDDYYTSFIHLYMGVKYFLIKLGRDSLHVLSLKFITFFVNTRPFGCSILMPNKS